MLRVVGGTLVILGAGAVGLMAVRQLRHRRRLLADFGAALEWMEAEISYRRTPLPELLEQLGSERGGACRGFFRACVQGLQREPERSLGALWCREINELPLTWEEREDLESLGAMLGRYDLEEQQRVLSHCRERLSLHLSRAEGEQREKGRLYGALSLVAGLFLVILLI